MEVPTDLFNHLVHLQLLNDDPSQKQHMDSGKVLLDKKQQLQLDSAFIVAQYLLKLNTMKPIANLNTVQLGALKASHNPTSKLFNWNTTVKEVEKLGIKVDSDSKSLMVAGDPECIIDLLQQIHEVVKKAAASFGNKSVRTKTLKKNKDGETPLDIVSLNYNRPLNETETSLEFIIVSLCQALAIQPKQAAGLLTNHNHYLLHACIKGVKSNYDPIINWYQLNYATSKHLTQLSIDNLTARQSTDSSQAAVNQPFYMLLNTLKCGFFSEYITVTEWTVKLFTKIAQDFEASKQLNEFFTWFIQIPNAKNGQLGGGFEATLYALNKHSQIVENISVLLACSFKKKFDKIITELRANHCKTKAQLPQILTELLPYLYEQSKDETLSKLLYESGIMEESIENADPESNQDNLLKASSLSLLAEIWSTQPQLIQENTKTFEEGSSYLDSVLKVFKRACRDKNRPLQLSTMGLLFKLLDQFAQVRNNQAPVIYKILTFSLIENSDDDVIREYMMNSFTEIYINHQSIPVSILVEPILRLLSMSEKPYHYNVFDFEFFAQLAKHPKLTPAPFGIQMMDSLAKIILNVPLWGQCASVPFVILADKFSIDGTIQDFLIKFCSITLTSILSLKKAFELVHTKGQPKPLALPPSEGMGSGGPGQKEDDDHTRKLRRYNIITIVKKIVNLKISEDFNDQLKELILTINRRHKQLYGTMCKGLVHLLEFWFPKAKQAMDLYLKEMDDADHKAIADEEARQAKLARNEEIARIKAKYYHHNNQQSQPEMKGYFSERDPEQESQRSGTQNSPRRRGSQGGQRSLVPWIHKEPKNPIEKKALQELENIRNKREERTIKQKYDEDVKNMKEHKNITNAREEITKRKIKLGQLKTSDSQALVLFQQPDQVTPHGTYPQGKGLKDAIATDNFKLLDLDEEEEDRDRDGVKLLLSKYQKPFKFLFNKYAMSRSQHKKVENFDYYGDKSINLAEINKLLRDHDVTQGMVSKDQLQQIMRLINNKFVKRLDLSALDFGAYMHLISQVSFFIYTNIHPHLSPSDMLLRLIQHFEKATRSRGQSTLLYEDPDATTIGDQEVLKEMNRRVKDNPDILLPEGYYKVYEKDQVYSYLVPDFVDIPESSRICIEVLDQILFESMNFHFLEALVTYEQRVKVKPRIKQTNMIAPPNAGLQYMKPIDKKQFNSRPSDSMFKSKTMSDSHPSSAASQVVYKRPQLGVEVKVALYQLSDSATSAQERIQLTETAEVLEEILRAVDQGLDFLPERERVKYTKDHWNKAKEDKQTKELQDRALEREREERRLKRKQQLEDELLIKKEEKMKYLEEQKQTKEQKDREAQEAALKEKEDRKLKLVQRKQETEAAKKVKLEELAARTQEDQEKRALEKELKKVEQKEFMLKQKERLEQEFQLRKKEQEEAVKAQVEFEEWKKVKQQKVKDKMENYLKTNKDHFKQEQKEREELQAFYTLPQVQQVYAKFDKALEYLFKFYASQDKKQINFQLGNALQRVNFNEFVKFGYQTFITPTVVPNEDMVMIFRALVRERRDQLSQKDLDELGSGVNSLGYEDFKKGLIRIAIVGQEILGGHSGQRLEAKLIEQLNNASGKPPIKAKSRGRSIHSSTTSKRNLLTKQNSTAGLDATTQRQQSQHRKTKEAKLISDLNKEKEKYEKMLSVKIEEKRMSKPFDVSMINPETIEALLKFIQLQPDDDQFKLDKKLNKQRIEVQGQKPNKVKKEITMQEMTGLANTHGGGQSGSGDHGGQQAVGIEAVEMDELERQSTDKDQQMIVGPNGQKENWKVDQDN